MWERPPGGQYSQSRGSREGRNNDRSGRQDLISHGGDLRCYHLDHDLTQMFKTDSSGEVNREEVNA